MRARRALLYMPGDDPHKIHKALSFGVDCICMDLEDGVALNRKDEARQTIAQALQNLDFGRSEKLVRVNPIQTGLTQTDLQAVLPYRPDAILLPKPDSAAEVLETCRMMVALEKSSGLSEGSVGMLVLIETARAVINLPGICGASRRIQALIYGAEDLAADMGAVRTPTAWETFYARSATVLHAAAFDLQAIDMVCNDFTNLEHLESEARQGLEMGYSGKQIIHPRQVEVVQKAFTPDEATVKKVIDLLDLFEEHQKNGVGAFAVDGKLVDMPVIKTAQRLLERARAAGTLPPRGS